MFSSEPPAVRRIGWSNYSVLQPTQIAERDAQPNSREPAIGDYAIIGDCRTAALVSRDGSIDWLCLPHFSGPSVFAALLDQERGGRFRIRPAAPFRSTRRYLDATGVLETTFETASGSARLRDLMPVVGNSSALQPLREVLRIVQGIEGEVTLEARWDPRPRYSRADAKLRSRGAIG
jgi:GH15 family glucan-1,4-alpha-glucosidase